MSTLSAPSGHLSQRERQEGVQIIVQPENFHPLALPSGELSAQPTERAMRAQWERQYVKKGALPLPLGEVARVSGSERVLDFLRKSRNIEYLRCKYSITPSVMLTHDSSPKGRAKKEGFSTV